MSQLLRVYLAGPSRELGRVQHYASQLEQSGAVTIMYRWWIDFLAEGGNDAELSRDMQQCYARKSRGSVLASDLLWALWPDSRSDGAVWETAMALEHHVPVVITGRCSTWCNFTALEGIFRDVEDRVGLHEVLQRAARAVRNG